MEESNRKTEKARWRMPRGCAASKTWEDFLDAEPVTMSELERTRTVSRSMNWDWDMVESHCCCLVDSFSAMVVCNINISGSGVSVSRVWVGSAVQQKMTKNICLSLSLVGRGVGWMVVGGCPCCGWRGPAGGGVMDVRGQ